MSLYLSLFSFSLIFTLRSAGTAKSIIRQVLSLSLSLLPTITRSGGGGGGGGVVIIIIIIIIIINIIIIAAAASYLVLSILNSNNKKRRKRKIFQVCLGGENICVFLIRTSGMCSSSGKNKKVIIIRVFRTRVS